MFGYFQYKKQGLPFWIYVITSTLNISQVGSTRVKQKLTLFTNAKTWNEAKSICESDGMRLLQIESQAKSITVDKFIGQWGSSINGDLWIGLHEVDETQPDIVKWADCNATLYQDFATPPSTTADDSFCYTLTSVGLNWKPARCDTVQQFICEKDFGLCEFDRYFSATGCSWPDKASADVAIAPCHSLCLDGVWANAKECWAIGFWNGYVGDDCWMFYSYDPDACVSNEYSSGPVVLYYKTCYIDDVNSTVVSVPSNTDIYPRSACFIHRATTVLTTDPVTTVAVETTWQDTTTTLIPETTSQGIGSTTTLLDTSIQDDTSATTTVQETTTSLETTWQETSEPITTMIQTSTGKFTTESNSETSGPITTMIQTSTGKFTTESSSAGQEATSSAPQETTSSISDSTILIPSYTSSTESNSSECLCMTKQKLTTEELESLLNDLSIDKKQTSIHKRRFYSPGDERTSARSIGYAGAIFLGISLGGIVLLDVQVLVQHFKTRFSRSKGQNRNKFKRDSVVKFSIKGDEDTI